MPLPVVTHRWTGYNTNWGIPIFKQIMSGATKAPSAKIRLVVIFFGANDASLPFSMQHVPLAKYAQNLSDMVEMITDSSSSRYIPDVKVVLVAPPPVNEVQWKERCEERGNPLDRSNELTKEYANAVKDVAKQHNVPVVDLWTEITNQVSVHSGNEKPLSNGKTSHRDLSDFLYDGLHLNALGNQVLYQMLMETIKTELPEIHPDNLPLELPEFFDVPQQEYDEVLLFKK